MDYSIAWTRTALNALAAIWNDSDDRNGVTTASPWLERMLSARPLSFGESRRTSIVRVAYRAPFGIEFEIIEDDKKVRVLRVWSVS